MPGSLKTIVIDLSQYSVLFAKDCYSVVKPRLFNVFPTQGKNAPVSQELLDARSGIAHQID
jgi:hypothetical protein